MGYRSISTDMRAPGQVQVPKLHGLLPLPPRIPQTTRLAQARDGEVLGVVNAAQNLLRARIEVLEHFVKRVAVAIASGSPLCLSVCCSGSVLSLHGMSNPANALPLLAYHGGQWSC